MTRRMWFYPAAALAVAAGLMASTAQASPATGSLNAVLTGVSEQSNLVEKAAYRDWRWQQHARYNQYRHYQTYNRYPPLPRVHEAPFLPAQLLPAPRVVSSARRLLRAGTQKLYD